MAIRNILPGIFYVGVNDWDRQMFDALMPLPLGTSYNSYVICGTEKTVLVDTAEPCKSEAFFENLLQLDISKIDYIIADHAEQDHSGLIPEVLKMFPEARVITNNKCKDLLKMFLGIDEDNFIVIKDGETLSLGGKTIEFIIAPWVHWPDTMFAYVKEDKILFSTDFFGSHIAESCLFVQDEFKVIDAAKRYYAQIMMPFRNNVLINLKKVEQLDINIIAPSHGQLYNNPVVIINAYREWSSDKVTNEVVIPFVSMHGSTEKMVEHLVNKLIERNINVKPFNLETADIGEIAMAIVNAATIIIGSPTVLLGAHPKAVYAAYLINILKPKTRFLGFVGSYGWVPKFVDSFTTLLSGMKSEIFEPVVVKGFPVNKDFEEIEMLAEKIYEKHKQIGII